MSATPVLIISEHAQAYADLLAAEHIDCLPVSSASELAEPQRRCEVLLGEPHLAAGVLAQLPELKWVQSTWAGLTPLVPAAAAGINVTGVKEVFGAQMTEYVLGYLLAHQLKMAQRRQWQDQRLWRAEPTGSVAGKTMGVMGTGSIGQAIAQGALALGMRVIGYNREGHAVDRFESIYTHHQRQEFLAQVDVLVTVLPDTRETAGLLDMDAFRAMPEHALLINVGRGTVVNEQQLAQALNTGELGAAVLDVFQTEPLPETHVFWNTPHLTITAHVAAQSYPRDIARLFVDNFRRWQAGQTLKFCLDPERGY